MTTPRPIRPARSSTLHKLAFTTALAGTLVLLPSAARAQGNNTPGGATVITPSGSNAPTFNGGGTGNANGNPTNLEVRLRAENTIINWNRFNIAQGSKVDFTTGLTSEVAVLNRVTGGDMSNIRGTLNSGSNVSVFLVNPNGIMVHGSGNVSTGSFVASTLDIRSTDFSAKDYSFSADPYGFGEGRITVDGRITTKGRGIGLILLGRQIISNGQLDSGIQDTALVAADDVTLSYTAGSPLGIQVTRGTDLGDAMRVVGGTVQGRNVYFAMATRDSANNSLLQIDADVRAVGGSKGIVIVGGQASVDPSVVVSGGNGTARSVAVETTGTLTYADRRPGGGVRIGGSNDVRVAGAVNSAGSYAVTGESVTLGVANETVLQRADAAVSIVATDGDITGLGRLTLTADPGGNGNQPLTLDAAGDIDFADTTTLSSGGPAGASSIHLFSGDRNADIRLGTVRARTLNGGISGGSLEGGVIRSGDFTAGEVTLGAGARIEADTLTLGVLTAFGAVSLDAGQLRASAVLSTNGAVTVDAAAIQGLTGGARTRIEAAQAVDIETSGAARLSTVRSAAGSVSIDAGSMDVSSVVAPNGARLVTRTGNLQLGGLSVASGGASIDAADDAIVTGSVGVGGGYSVIGDSVQLSGTQSATGAVTVTARALNGSVSNTGNLVLTANSDGPGIEALTLRGRVTLDDRSTLNGGASRQSNVVIDTNLLNGLRLGNVDASALLIAGGGTLLGDIRVGDVITAGNLALLSAGAVASGDLTSTGGGVQIRGATIDVDTVRAGGAVSFTGRQIDFDAISASTATLESAGLGTRYLRGDAISTTGLTTLTGDGGAIEIGDIVAGNGLNVRSVGAVEFDTLDITGTASVVTTGGSSYIRINDSIDATGAITLTGAQDIFVASAASSAGALTITAARDATGVNGGRAALSAASDVTVAAGRNARLRAVTAGAALRVQAASIDTLGLSGASGISLDATAGSLTVGDLRTVAGDATLGATGATRVSGSVSIGGNYAVSGGNVVLAGAQNATGSVDITARSGGSIGSGAGLVLTANADGVGAEALTLHGRADLSTDSVLRGGPNRQSQVIIDAGANTNIRLGDVDASSLAIAGGAALSGSLTFGDVVTSDSVSLTVDGGIVAGGLTSLSGAVTLAGEGGATIGTVAGTAIDIGMAGAVDVGSFAASGGAARFVSRGGGVTLGSGTATDAVRIEAAGRATVDGAITAGTDYVVRGASVTLGSDYADELQSAAGTIDITTTSGAIVGGRGLTLRSGAGPLLLDGAGGIDLGAGVLQAGIDGTGVLGVRAGDGQAIDLGDSVRVGTLGSLGADHATIAGTLTHSGDLRFGTLTVVNPIAIQLTAGNLTGLAIAATSSVTIAADAGIVDVGAIDAASLSVTGGAIRGGSYRAAGGLALDGGTITLAEIESTTGSATATARAGTVSIDRARAAVDLTLTATGAGNVSVGTASAGRNLSLIARNGDILNDSATAGGVLTLDATGDIRGRNTGNPDLSGNDIVLVVVGNLITNSITSPGSLSVTASSITADRASAGGALSLTANRGALSIGTATATGAISLTATGAISVGTLTSSGGGLAIDSGGNFSAQRITVPGAATILASGSATLGSVSVGGLTMNAASIDAGVLTVNGASSFTSTRGDIGIDGLTSQGAITIDSAGDASLDAWETPAGLTVTAIGDVALGTGSASGLTVTGTGLDITDASVSGAVNLTGTGGVTIGALSGGDTTIIAGSALTIDALTAGATRLQAQTSQLGALSLGTLTLSGGSATIADATVKGAAMIELTGALDIGQLRADTLDLQAGGILAEGLTSTGTTRLTSAFGAIDLGQLTSGGAATIDSAAGIAIDGWQTPAALTLTAARDVVLGNGSAGGLTLTATSAQIGDARITGAATLLLTGALDIDRLDAAGLSVTAGSIVAGEFNSAGTTDLATKTGALEIGALDSSGAITIAALGNARIDAFTSPAALTITSGDGVVLGAGSASSLKITALSVGITDATLVGAADLEASGSVAIGTLAAGDTRIIAGTGLTIDRLSANAAVLQSDSTRLGTLTAATLTATGGAIDITDATLTGAASIDVTGALTVDRLRATEVTLLSGGMATLGDVGGSSSVMLRAQDVTLDGPLRAPLVTIASRDATAGLRLGSAGNGQGDGIGLSDTEIGRIDADRAVFDGGSGTVTIGTVTFGTATGRSRVDVLTSGEMVVDGVVTGSGAGRTFRFGGAADSDTSLAKAIKIIATSDAGGRLLFNDADVELRGARIGVGQSGLIDELFVDGGISADGAAALIGNSDSPLYNALFGGTPYVPGSDTTLSARRLTLRFDDFALFQNTGTRGFNNGVVLAGDPASGPTLSLIGPGNGARTAFAMFGTINEISGTSTAVLGSTVISTEGIDFANARINGCVLGTGAGCLTTTISQPTLNVFDPSRLVVFQAQPDFTIPFDPVIGSNNEALFAGGGDVADPADPAPDCRPGEAGCTPAQQDSQ